MGDNMSDQHDILKERQSKGLRDSKRGVTNTLIELRCLLRDVKLTDLTNATSLIERSIDDLEKVQRRLARVST